MDVISLDNNLWLTDLLDKAFFFTLSALLSCHRVSDLAKYYALSDETPVLLSHSINDQNEQNLLSF